MHLKAFKRRKFYVRNINIQFEYLNIASFKVNGYFLFSNGHFGTIRFRTNTNFVPIRFRTNTELTQCLVYSYILWWNFCHTFHHSFTGSIIQCSLSCSCVGINMENLLKRTRLNKWKLKILQGIHAKNKDVRIKTLKSEWNI